MNVDIAERLAARRRDSGLSQEALAEKLGVSRQAVSKWERSESSPDTDNLIALAQLYGVSLDDLLYVDGSIKDDVAFEAADRAEQRKVQEGAIPPPPAPASEPKESETEEQASENTYNAEATDEKKKKEYVHIGLGGIHVEDGEDSVHVSWKDGVHVNSGKTGDEVHVGWNGVHVKEARKHARQYRRDHVTEGVYTDNIGNTFVWDAGGVDINGEHFDSWQEARDKYGHWPFVGSMTKKNHWLKFPFPLLAIVAYLLIGFYTNEWGTGLFVFFSIPVYYMIGHAISEKRFAPFIAGLYPLAVVAWFLWMAFVLGEPHPAWVAFLTIPIVEWIVHALSASAQRRRMAKERPIEVNFEVESVQGKEEPIEANVVDESSTHTKNQF